MAQNVYQIEYGDKVYTVEADNDADALKEVERQAGGVSEETPISNSGLPPGTGAGIGSALGYAAATEPVRRGLRGTTALVFGGGPQLAAKGAGLVSSALGSTFLARLAAPIGMPFAGGTVGARVGAGAGRGFAGVAERTGDALRAGLGNSSLQQLGHNISPTTGRLATAQLAAEPFMEEARAASSNAASRTEPAVVQRFLDRAAKLTNKADKAASRSEALTLGSRNLADKVFGRTAGTVSKLTTRGLVGNVGRIAGPALGAVSAYQMLKDLYDRHQRGEEIPASELATVGGVGALNMFPLVSTVMPTGLLRTAGTVARGGRAAVAAEEANALRSTNTVQQAARNAVRSSTPGIGGRASGAGIRAEADDLTREIMEGRTGGARPEPRGSSPNRTELVQEMIRREPTNVERSTATEAVARGQGPSGGHRGVTGASRARSVPDPDNLLGSPFDEIDKRRTMFGGINLRGMESRSGGLTPFTRAELKQMKKEIDALMRSVPAGKR